MQHFGRISFAFTLLLFFNTYLSFSMEKEPDNSAEPSNQFLGRLHKTQRDSYNKEVKEIISVTAQEASYATICGLFDHIGRHTRVPSPGNFSPIFEGEGTTGYEKLDGKLIHSLIESAPEKLKFVIKVYGNPRTYKQLSQNSCFKNKFLLHGPPGSGKSSLAKAFADYCNIPRQFIVAASLFNQYQHSGVQNVRLLFESLLSDNRRRVIIFDEFTGIASTDEKKQRNDEEKTLTVLLNVLDQIEQHKNVIFIATTNKVQELPEQIKDRFTGSMFKITAPDFNRRMNFVQNFLSDEIGNKEETGEQLPSLIDDEGDEPLQISFISNLTEKDQKSFARKTSHLSLRDLNEVRDGARILALRDYVDDNFNITALIIPVEMNKYFEAIKEIYAIKKETKASDWKWYKERFKEFYPLFLSTVQVCAGLYLQYESMQQQMHLTESFQQGQMLFYKKMHKKQMKFQKDVHEQQKIFQEMGYSDQVVTQENQLALQVTSQANQLKQNQKASDEQLVLQKKNGWWQLGTQAGIMLLSIGAQIAIAVITKSPTTVPLG